VLVLQPCRALGHDRVRMVFKRKSTPDHKAPEFVDVQTHISESSREPRQNRLMRVTQASGANLSALNDEVVAQSKGFWA
jgi:hypothetical protein